MGKVVVGLWSRNTLVRRNVHQDTLHPLERAIARTSFMAAARSLGSKPAAAEAVTSIFVAPEFLFTQPQTGYVGTMGMPKQHRDDILQAITRMAEARKNMLLIPGTIIFKEEFNPRSLARAYLNLSQAMEPKHLTLPVPTKLVPVKARGPVGSRPPAVSAPASAGPPPPPVYRTELEVQQAPVPTYETYESPEPKAYYDKQRQAVEEHLTAFEKNRLVTEPNALRYSFLIKNRTYVFFNGRKIFSYGKKTNMNDFKHDPLKERGIYIPGRHEGVTRIGRLWVGFEVCLEHSLGILKQHMPGDLDLHIILSGFIDNRPDKFCSTKAGGYTIHASSEPDFTGVFRRVDSKENSRTRPIAVSRLVHSSEVKPEDKQVEVLEGGRIKVTTPQTYKEWDNIEPMKEIDFEGGPLRFYEIDLPN